MSRSNRGSPVRASPKVHIVGKADRWILGRYARILIDQLGWSMSERGQSSVDVNLYWPYLLINVGDRLVPGVKSAAFFTHMEEAEQDRSRNSKVNRWHYAAKVADLRICMSEKYRAILEPSGPTVHVPVPIEEQFTPKKLRVGVAGKVYALSRKGEDLVQKLVDLNEFDLVGAGEGWPCPTTFYRWDQMPAFYQSLDVFLVTSEVEGGPVTMLEALRCGVPVLAPAGVGMVDEFDVATYKRGDFQSLVSRLRLFQLGRAKRFQCVANRTAENFAQACQKAIEQIC